ncbi:MAG: hypothetical protein RIC85_04740 [Gammaproteobacteria bacterium]
MDAATELAQLRDHRAASTPHGFRDVSDFHDGVYDSDFLSPYTKSAHNTESDILIFLQDWISEDVLSGPLIPEAVTFGRIPTLPTNKNLDRLLAEHFDKDIADVYATNLFPYVKPGNMSAGIPFTMLKDAAETFALRHIEILKPKLIVALGLNCFNALAVALGNKPVKPLASAIGSPLDVGEGKVWAQAHSGALGQNARNRDNKRQTDTDWREMANWYQSAA